MQTRQYVRRVLVGGTMLVALTAAVLSTANAHDDERQALLARLNHLTTLEADFAQQVTDAQGELEIGRASCREREMRWEGRAEDGIRDFHVTGVQTCALPILQTRQYVRRVLVGGTMLVALTAAVLSTANAHDDERQALLARLNHLTTLEADFAQQVTDAQGEL